MRTCHPEPRGHISSFCLTTLDTLPSGFVSPWPGRALLDPWLPDQQTVVIRRGLPRPTTQQETHKLQDSQPQPCPDGAAAPGPLFALRTPHTPTLGRSAAHPSPPFCLAPTPSPSQQLAAPARAHTSPTPPPTCPTGGGGHRAAELTLQVGSERGPFQGPRRSHPPPFPAPTAAESDAVPGPP